MSIIEVYHGTTLNRAKAILKSGVIKVTDENTFRYEDTTKGYVYVTKRLCDALDFSTRPIVGENTLAFVVFKILIDENELLKDYDEEKWISTISDGGEKDCFKIKRDLLLNQDVKSYFYTKMQSNNAVGNYIQSIQYGECEIKESEWKSLCHD